MAKTCCNRMLSKSLIISRSVLSTMTFLLVVVAVCRPIGGASPVASSDSSSGLPGASSSGLNSNTNNNAPLINNNKFETPAMPECEPYYIAGVYTAVCMRRRLSHVPRNLMTSIQVMDASNNELVALRDGEFRSYPWLREIYLQENKIRHIGRNAFANLTRLHTLVLTSNDLTQLDPDVFRYLTGLRVLRLSNNPLRILRRETFRNLRQLAELRIDSCLLTKIEPGTLKPFIGSLEILSVAYNQLTIFNADLSLPSQTQQGQPLALKEVHLYGNPWHCNCQMRMMRLLLNESPDVTFNFGSDLKTPTCYTPQTLSGQMWSRIPADRFGCEPVVTGANMPPLPIVGTNITLQCSFAADPSPTFRWFKDGIAISDVETSTESILVGVSSIFRGKIRQKDRKLAAHNFTSRLDLIEITAEFSGTYECVAENTAGSSRSKFQLRVRSSDGRYELSPPPEPEMSAGLLTALVASDAARSPTTRLIIVAGVVGTVVIIFLLVVTSIYFCFCRRRSEKDNTAVAILRKIEAKRLALNNGHDATMSLRKNILSNSSSLHSHLRHSQLDGEDVKLTEVYPSHLAATSPISDESGGKSSNNRESSNSTCVTNDRSGSSSHKSSPDNSTSGNHRCLGVEHLSQHSDDEALTVPLCGNIEAQNNQLHLNEEQSIQDLAMAQSAAFKTYSEYLSLTLPKMIHSPRFATNRSNSGAFDPESVIRERNQGLLQATLCRQLPILSAYGYVEQVSSQPPPPKISMNDLSDLDLSDIDSASQVGSRLLISQEHARLALAYQQHQQQQHQQQQNNNGRRQQRYTGSLHHSVFLPAPMSFSSSSAATTTTTPPTNSSSSKSANQQNNLVHFLDEPAPKLMASSTTSSGDTSV